MNSRQKHSRSGTILFVAALFVVGGLLFVRPELPQSVRSGAFLIGTPFWSIDQSVRGSLASVTSSLRSKEKLEEENRQLKLELEELRLQQITNEFVREENRALKEVFGRYAEEEVSVFARVLKRPTQTLYDTVVLDVGTNAGLAEGNIVYTETFVPIGRVSEVLAYSSIVTLFSAPGVETEVLIGEELVSVTARGRGGGNYELSVPRDLPIFEGDPLVSSHDIDNPIGIVSHINASPTDAFKTVLFRIPVSLSKLAFVFVDTRYEEL